jgi:preprotein translocase subunit SecD
MLRWLIVLLCLVGGVALCSMVAFLCLPFVMNAYQHQIDDVLVYEMEGLKPEQNATELAEKTVAVFNHRLQDLPLARGEAQVIENNRIKVCLYGTSPSNLKNVSEIVEHDGKLEFRIVANIHKHKEIIKMAKDDPEKPIYLDSEGEWIARWVMVKNSNDFSSPNNLTRIRKVGDTEITEVLVVWDPYDVTSDYLIQARADIDNGSHIVLFTFNHSGGQLLHKLTANNLPDSAMPQNKNRLGIILDGVVFSAPNITSVIAEQGQITGNFTASEAANIAGTLTGGPLPVKLRKVEEHKFESK